MERIGKLPRSLFGAFSRRLAHDRSGGQDKSREVRAVVLLRISLFPSCFGQPATALRDVRACHCNWQAIHF